MRASAAIFRIDIVCFRVDATRQYSMLRRTVDNFQTVSHLAGFSLLVMYQWHLKKLSKLLAHVYVANRVWSGLV
jgi:hypothetical protein